MNEEPIQQPPVPEAQATSPPAAEAQPLTAPTMSHVIVARHPETMEAATGTVAAWCAAKIAELREEETDYQENYEIAMKNGWGASALYRALNRVGYRIEFYTKLKAAAEAGYCIVPNFPVDVIAIRTTRKNPDRMESTASWTNREQKCEILIPGTGEWRSPDPEVYSRQYPTGKDGAMERHYHAESFRGIEFPFVLAKPEVYAATEKAMVEKVFDDIGVLPAQRRKGDPIVVGRIYDRSAPGRSKIVTFLVAWWIDTRDL